MGWLMMIPGLLRTGWGFVSGAATRSVAGGGWALSALALAGGVWLGMRIEAGGHLGEYQDRATQAEALVVDFEERLSDASQHTEDFIAFQRQVFAAQRQEQAELRPLLADLRSCPLGGAGRVFDDHITAANRLFGGTGVEFDRGDNSGRVP